MIGNQHLGDMKPTYRPGKLRRILEPMYFYYNTRKGPVAIVYRRGKWHLLFQDREIGSYVSAHGAANDAGEVHAYGTSSDSDLASLGIPKDLDRWSYAKP